MNQQQSLADKAIECLSAVSKMGEQLGNDAVERHTVRGMKQAAEKMLDNAFFVATELAYRANQLSIDLKGNQ